MRFDFKKGRKKGPSYRTADWQKGKNQYKAKKVFILRKKP